MFKKSWENFGSYQVYLVDEEEIRDLSLAYQEFSNYGIHSDFPNLIPKREIWLSKSVSEEESFFLVNEALCRIKFESIGVSSKKAYYAALSHDKALRHKSFHSKHINIPTKNKPPDDLYIKQLGTYDDVNIYLVDGNLVRNLFKTDFVEGGHDYVYHFVPRGEIWIDIEVSEHERPLVILHEIIERGLMRNKKLSYDKAHKKASKIEWRLRSLIENTSTT